MSRKTGFLILITKHPNFVVSKNNNTGSALFDVARQLSSAYIIKIMKFFDLIKLTALFLSHSLYSYISFLFPSYVRLGFDAPNELDR